MSNELATILGTSDLVGLGLDEDTLAVAGGVLQTLGPAHIEAGVPGCAVMRTSLRMTS